MVHPANRFVANQLLDQDWKGELGPPTYIIQRLEGSGPLRSLVPLGILAVMDAEERV